MSLKTLFFELGAEVIVTLYLIEHDSTKLVIFFCLLDIAIVIWKLTRTFKFRITTQFPFLTLTTSELYKKREQVDSQAIWYMNYLLLPLSLAYFGWSLYSKGGQIKSVYTFLLENAVAFIAIFGFIMMTPQLYINYKLKSVEHMNWRGLIYRFINTILDDIFAFMVTIPTLRRLMYFRDGTLYLTQISSSSSISTKDGSTKWTILEKPSVPWENPLPSSLKASESSSNHSDFRLNLCNLLNTIIMPHLTLDYSV